MEQFLSRSTCQSLCKQASSEFYQAYTDTGVDAIMNADFSTPNNAAARLFSDSFGGFLSHMCTTVHTCKAAAAIEQGGDVAAPLCFRSFFLKIIRSYSQQGFSNRQQATDVCGIKTKKEKKRKKWSGVEWRPFTLSKKEQSQYTRTAGQYSPTTQRSGLASYRTCTIDCRSQLHQPVTLGVIYPTVQVINDRCFSLNRHDTHTHTRP